MWSNKRYAAQPMGADGLIYSLCTFGVLRCRACGRVWAWRPTADVGRWGIWLPEALSEAVQARVMPKGYIFRAARIQCVEPECMDAEPEFLGEAVLTHEGKWIRLPEWKPLS